MRTLAILALALLAGRKKGSKLKPEPFPDFPFPDLPEPPAPVECNECEGPPFTEENIQSVWTPTVNYTSVDTPPLWVERGQEVVDFKQARENPSPLGIPTYASWWTRSIFWRLFGIPADPSTCCIIVGPWADELKLIEEFVELTPAAKQYVISKIEGAGGGAPI